MTTTPAKGLTQPQVGADNNTWGGLLNTNLALIDDALGGTLSLSISGNTTLSSVQIENAGYQFTGTLSGNATIGWPSFSGMAAIQNSTAGGFSIICGISGGAAVTVLNGETVAIWSDGTNFQRLAQAGGGATVSNAALQNSSITISGHTVPLGGSVTLSGSDLTNGTTGTGPIVLQTALSSVVAVTTLATFSTGNTDFAIPVPVPYTRQWSLEKVTISNATSSLAGTTGGVFFNPGGSGATLAADQAMTVTQSSGNFTPNMQSLSLTNANTEAYQGTQVYFRVGTGGVAAAADVCLRIAPLTYTALFAWGDSLTAGTGSTGGETYPGQLTNLFSPFRRSFNEGVGGDTSSQILTRFNANTASHGYGTIIWSGRNDYVLSSTVQSNIAAMAGALIPGYYLVLSVINGDYPTNEYRGQTGYNQITALNAALAASYGSHFVDVRSALVAAYNPLNPIDVIDHNNDVPPYSLRGQDANGTLVGSISPTTTAFSVTNVAVTVDYVLAIGSEYILVTAISSGGNITACVRGYAGTTPAAYSSGTSYTGTDPLHLGNAGYAIVANAVYQAMIATGGW